MRLLRRLGRFAFSWRGLLALAALVGLAALGALALAWPWLSEEAPRAVAAGWGVVQTTVAEWLGRLWAALPRVE